MVRTGVVLLVVGGRSQGCEVGVESASWSVLGTDRELALDGTPD